MKTQEPVAMEWWQAFLSLWRGILLARRAVDPEALRALLVLLPPVTLDWVDLQRLLHWENLYGYPNREHFDVPEDWTLGPPLCGEDDEDILEAANSKVLLELVKEQKQFKNHWELIVDCDGNTPHLSYRVVDDHGKATPIASFMQGKLAPWKQGEPLNEAEYNRLGKLALANNILCGIQDAQYHGEGGDEELDELLFSLDLRTLPKDWAKQTAEHLWDSACIRMDPDSGPHVEDWKPMLEFARSLVGTKGAGKRRGKKATAAILAA